METFKIRLWSVEDVRDFVRLAAEQPYPVQVRTGEKTVNGKSFMGMFSLDGGTALTVTASGDDCTAFLTAAKRFMV
ncbi:MAG: HPr family phosphocarrier protein [Firmicutes bacterium]|nr:HPr family phosphocarrier protein [Bacillota bacterium]MDY2719962.1 HPr family phosphocarrier protein [Candidatus Faecousia sp.]